MPNVRANGIRIEYDIFGYPASSPLLLIMGHSAQMIAWDEELCREFVNKGFYVIRFDNRDVGLSSKMDEAPVVDIMDVYTAISQGKEIEAPYTLDDMADDTIGLLDALHIEKAHICGVSMGGMIAQIMAIRYPQRVLSLTSMMSATGNPEISTSKPDNGDFQFKPPPKNRDAYINHAVEVCRIIGSPGFEFDEERIRRWLTQEYDRCFCPEGSVRQLLAILKSGNRKPKLATITVPTLVIHGTEDPLVPVEWGKDTAEAVPGAELLIIEGMGHDLPRQVWPRIVGAITANAKKAEA